MRKALALNKPKWHTDVIKASLLQLSNIGVVAAAEMLEKMKTKRKNSEKKMKTGNEKISYGFMFYCNRNTTTGQINKYTGKCNIAGEFLVFYSKVDLKIWLNEEDSFNKEKIKVSKKELKKLCAGMTQKEFDEHLDMLNY